MTAAAFARDARLADARFAIHATPRVPTRPAPLRLTYGRIERSNVPAQRFAAFTTLSGLWERATGAPPFDVAPKLAARDRIDPNTVRNITVSTDTIGGSSGSPPINAACEIIGANFDSTVLTQRHAHRYDRHVKRSIIVPQRRSPRRSGTSTACNGFVAEPGGPAQTAGDIPGQPRGWSAPAALSLYPGVTGLRVLYRVGEAKDVLETRCLRTSAHGIGCTASRSQ